MVSSSLGEAKAGGRHWQATQPATQCLSAHLYEESLGVVLAMRVSHHGRVHTGAGEQARLL